MGVPFYPRMPRTGPARPYQNLRFWALEGLIACQDERPGVTGKGDYQVMTPKTFKERLDALVNYNKRKRDPLEYCKWQREETQKNLRQLQELEKCYEEAKRMGDPSDPKVQEFWLRHRPGSKSTISTGDIYKKADLPRIEATGPIDPAKLRPTPTMKIQAPSVGEAVAGGIVVHQPPRRRARAALVL